MGDEREKTDPELSYPVKDKDDAVSHDSIKKTTACNRMVIVGCLVCIVTAIVVAGIAVPLSKDSVKCDECEDTTCPTQSPTTSTRPTTQAATTSNPPPTTTTQPPPTTTTTLPPFDKRSTDAVTSLGTVVGHEVDMDTGNPRDNCMSWLGVRYAKANPGRWEKPEPAEPIPGGRQIADHHRTMCPQGGGIFSLSGQTQRWGGNFGEDCLFVNIFAPVDKSRGPYPVMLYFYGGAYQGGGALQYPGQTLVGKGVVVVAMNYRLGIFGFASTTDGYLKGNYGLWDQFESMRYVKNHIAAFGGDPNKVTIFGQSAGAGSIGAHLVSPIANDYFDQALLQSGNELSFWAFNSPLQEPGKLLPQVAARVGCETAGKTEEEWVACMRQVPQEDLRRNNRFDCHGFCLGMVPVIDGEYVPEHPFFMMDRGEMNDKPTMIGANTGECHLYVLGRYGDWAIPERTGFNRTAFQEEVAEVTSWFEYLLDTDDYNIEEAYQFVNFYYSPWGKLNDLTENKEVIGQMCTDGAWTANTAQMLKMRARHGTSKLFQYTNGVSTEPIIPPLPGWLRRGIPHEFEIPHVWNWPRIYFSDSEQLKNDTFDLHLPFGCWSDMDVQFSEFIQTLWTNFAIYGEPTPTPIKHPRMDEPVTWHAYDNEDYYYFYMDNELAGSFPGFRLREAAIFNEYLPKLARGEFANPDEVQFVPYPSKGSVASADTKEEALHNEVIKRTKRSAVQKAKNRFAEAFKEGMIGENLMDSLKRPDGPIMTIIKNVLIPRLNATLIENRDITINELIDMIVETIRDTRCVKTVGYFYRAIIEDNIDAILDFIRDFFKDVTVPPGLIPTLPPRPTFPIGRR